jgi:hypothetical protein
LVVLCVVGWWGGGVVVGVIFLQTELVRVIFSLLLLAVLIHS